MDLVRGTSDANIFSEVAHNITLLCARARVFAHVSGRSVHISVHIRDLTDRHYILDPLFKQARLAMWKTKCLKQISH